MAQSVERVLGKDEVGGSNPPSSSIKKHLHRASAFFNRTSILQKDVRNYMKKTPNFGQRQVIDCLDNNIILFASAGTGKTFTVAERVANILSQNRATAEEILCLTFTIKASNEMKEKLQNYVAEVGKRVQVSTIHGFCYKLILEEGKRLGGAYGEWSVCDEVDQEEILRSILSSRFYYWKLEQNLAKKNLSLPRLEDCEIKKKKGSEEFFWEFDNKLLAATGEVYDISAQTDFLPVSAFCAACNKVEIIKNRRCARCGKEISFELSTKYFEVFRKKSGLRNLVSEIKHNREEKGFYSDNEIEDYQQSFNDIKENDTFLFEELTSYYARYLGYASDEEFTLAMDAFAGRLVAEYDEHLRLSNLLDFDDLILQAKHVLDTEEGLAYWSNRYKYVIVDEMQDTSTLEYEVLKRIFAKNNVMLCGDFFQTIYSWRGSRPELILQDYIDEFSAKIYMLSENYRATKALASATFGYLKNTYGRFTGKYCPEDLQIHSGDEGEKIFCYAFDNREQEAWHIYKYLLRQSQEDRSNTCIIARSNKYIAELSSFFERFSAEREDASQLRFFTVEEHFQFFKKPLVKDVLAVLKLLINEQDRVSMERLTEKYVRQVGIKSIEDLRRYNEVGVSIVSLIDRQTHEFGDPYYHLIAGMQAGNVVIYDTETTGLDVTKDQIVQLSAIKINAEGEVLETLDTLVEPTVPIDAEAEKTHGFNAEYIRMHGGVSAYKALARFIEFTKGCILVGHNNFAYDKPLVERQLLENGLPQLDIVAEYDTLLLAKQFYPQLENLKLSTLCQQFSVVNECAHNALGDITATGQCLAAMFLDKILPTAMERRSILSKYLSKFVKFYEFMEEMRQRLKEGLDLGQTVIDRLLLTKRYPTHADLSTMQDLVESLQIETANKKEFLKEYLKDAALSGSQMDVLLAKSNRIPVITVHQAKGCEFDTVIIAGADDSNFPSFAAKQSGDEEEEKKVFYVAITRAKKKLILTRATHNGRYEMNETPYFWSIPEEYVRVNNAWKNGN